MTTTPSKLSPIDDGGPAYPVEVEYHSDGSFTPVQTGPRSVWTPGMSLRDHFAGQIAAAIFGGLVSAKIDTDQKDTRTVARTAYEMADALLTARKGGGERV